MRRLLSPSKGRGESQESQAEGCDDGGTDAASTNEPPPRSTGSSRVGSFFNKSSESAAAPSDEKSPKKKKGFGFGNFTTPKFTLSSLNPLKRSPKKGAVAKGGVPPPPDRPIAMLFASAKYKAHLLHVCSYLPFISLGRLAQVSMALQDFVLDVLQTPLRLASYRASIPTRYYLYQTLLRDHLLARNRTATDVDIPKHVLSYLNLKDRLMLTTVCRRFIRIVGSMDLRLWGQHQGHAFVQGYDIESKAFWLVRHCYARTTSISLNYMTSPQVQVFLNALAHGCFPKVTHFHLGHVHFVESPLHLCTQLLEALDQAQLWAQLESLSLQGFDWTLPGYAALFAHLFQRPSDRLRHLDLSDNALEHLNVVRLSPWFVREHLHGLTSWTLRNTTLTSASFPEVLTCLEHLPSLQALDVSANDLGLDAWDALGAYCSTPRSVFTHLVEFNCSGTSYNVSGMLVLFRALSSVDCVHLTTLDVSDSVVALAKCLVLERIPRLRHLNLARTQLTAESFPLLTQAFAGKWFYIQSAQRYEAMPGHALTYLNVSGNVIGAGMAALWTAMTASALRSLETLIVSYTHLAMQEFNAMAQTFRRGQWCPALRHIDLSGNAPKSTGIIRFASFFQSTTAQQLRHLDLSYNDVDSATLDRLVDAIEASFSPSLMHLNVSRNLRLQGTTIAHVNQMVRGPSCPSLRCLLMGDTATPDAGFALVKHIRSHQSPAALERRREELRAAKRDAFEAASRQAAIETDERTTMKCAIRRALYDRLEAEAAQANRVASPGKRHAKSQTDDLPIFRKMSEEILATLGGGLYN
ncbi:hypothetical protein SPRG_04260 [Saprolegnia parasitica CBS 223.65]|uniref:F-box domain-containing protein n=1 Tax=Saprolegnia parasitica (strain CBS 223.65) TaxID=695850 RepID=A0A067CX75_SAPPC|nr:hypothetical protein SPRG_04260 [Saprolegnia parasitica CBS 223.65]KDO31121.1 hypothetical protein SPRG_04260 [Saprolegnia parasitica CBS 223.65]|eukprot:XP_012198250.1 hypothetical protein SPRG_04260 [Saprolegnia parasitica CBS 223.65]